jgi:hypothetical protein
MTTTATIEIGLDTRLLRVAYVIVNVAAGLAAAWWGPTSLEGSLALATGCWATISLALRPGWRSAGAVLTVVLILVLFIDNHPGLELSARLWAIVAIGLTVVALRALPLDRSPFFPFLHLYLLMQGTYLVVALLVAETPDLYRDIFTAEIRTAGFALLTVFTVILVAAGLLTSRLLWRRAESTLTHGRGLDAAAVLPRAYALVLASLGFGLAARVSGLDSALGSLPTIARLIGFGGAALLALLWLRGQLASVHKIVLLAATGALMLGGIGTGVLYQAAPPGLILFALVIAERRRIPWLLLVAATSLLVILNAPKTEFRQEQREGSEDRSSTELGVAYLDRVLGDTARSEQSAIAVSAYRFANQSDQLGYFARWVPDRYPHYGYAHYANLPRVLLPRALDPSKPAWDANEVGRRYELVGLLDFETSVNPSPAAEAYVAGGPRFMAIVAIGIGVFLVGGGYVLRSRRAAVIVTGALLSFQVLMAVESGVLSLFMMVPFGVLLYPIMRWAAVER